MNTIFVYGLLKPGFSLHHVAAPYVKAAAAATTRGRIYDAGVPAARFDEDGTIDGFVLSLDPDRMDEVLAVFDDLEDEGNEYRRCVIEVQTQAGPARAYAYEYLMPVDGFSDVGSSWTDAARPRSRID